MRRGSRLWAGASTERRVPSGKKVNFSMLSLAHLLMGTLWPRWPSTQVTIDSDDTPARRLHAHIISTRLTINNENERMPPSLLVAKSETFALQGGMPKACESCSSLKSLRHSPGYDSPK